VEEVDP